MSAVVNPLSGLEIRASQGDPSAFGELIRLWDHDLRGVVWSVVRSAVDTDDVMQISYEKAFRTIETVSTAASLKSWLYSICYRSAIDHFRYENRRRHESAAVLDLQPSSSATGDEAIGRAELASVLAALDDEQRALLMLVAGRGYSFTEAAAITGLPRGTVASKVNRARQVVRRFEDRP